MNVTTQTECEHLNIVDWDYQEDIIVGTCRECGASMWCWLASEYGRNAGGGRWEPMA